MAQRLRTSALRSSMGVAAFLAGSVGLLAAHAQDKGAAPTAPACKITPVEAFKAATQKAPGRALSATFEFDEGNWVYTVLIVSDKTIKEVQVDAMSGKAGDAETVTPEHKAQDVRDDLTAAIDDKAAGK